MFFMQNIYSKIKTNFWVFTTILLAISCGQNSEPSQAPSDLSDSIEIPSTETSEVSTDGKKTILFFGNSLTAGYGLELSQAFPAIIQRRIDSLELPYTVINAGISGETTADGKSRIDWVIKEQKIDVFILELGANDGLRGIPPTETRKNLKSIISQVKARYPESQVLICGMEVPPNLGEDYASQFRNIFRDLSDSLETNLLPFLLDKVAGEPELNLPDGIHPTPEGHEIVAGNIWEVLSPLL